MRVRRVHLLFSGTRKIGGKNKLWTRHHNHSCVNSGVETWKFTSNFPKRKHMNDMNISSEKMPSVFKTNA